MLNLSFTHERGAVLGGEFEYERVHLEVDALDLLEAHRSRLTGFAHLISRPN